MRNSYDSARRPLSDYQQTEFTGAYTPPRKKRISNWIKFGIPVLILVIAGAVVGGVLGSRAAKNASAAPAKAGSSGGSGGDPAVQQSADAAIGAFAVSTDSNGWPIYPTTTNNAAFGQPTFAASAANAWPVDSFQPTTPTLTDLRPDRPRLLAPKYKWDTLTNLVKTDAYMKSWHSAILAKAAEFGALPLVNYTIDGYPDSPDGGLSASGVLDPSRDVKQRIKAYAYSYRMTGSSDWIDKAWAELNNAAGNGPNYFGIPGNNWNTAHFLDTAEFTAAFAIAYDWLYDMWSDAQKKVIRDAIVNLGLKNGLAVLQKDPNAAPFGWWSGTGSMINGNWNCVSNGGMVLGALAILNDDDTGTASSILPLAVDNANQNCVNGPSTDGTWSETSDYWYFGTTGHAEMTSALISATGGDHGLLNTNANFKDTGMFHIYVTGMTAKFSYGDHGPNKFSTTANSMFFYGSAYNIPVYTLWQRDRNDAPTDPWSMFWYDPSVSGAWWDNYPLDHFFDDDVDQWASMRNTWTDNNGLFVAMKGGKNQGHQTHNDLDAGDFVLDAMGVRWAGELGSANYIATDYFSNDTQISARWHWYRKMTEGQNTLAINGQNQNVEAAPKVNHDTSGTVQGSSTLEVVPQDSSAYFVVDLATAYFGAAIKRGVHLINGRKQVLIQDEINNVADQIQWRMHTNATITVDGATATLVLEGKKMLVTILNPPDGYKMERLDPVRTAAAPTLLPGQEADQENRGVSVLAITLPGNADVSYTLQVLFSPQWPGMAASDFVTPASVPLGSWSLTSPS